MSFGAGGEPNKYLKNQHLIKLTVVLEMLVMEPLM